MRTSTWIAAGVLIVLAALCALWWTSRAPAPQSVDIAPSQVPSKAPAAVPSGAHLEPAPAPAQPEPEAPRVEAPVELVDPRTQKLDVRGGGLSGRVLHAAPLPEVELFDASAELQECGLPARCPTGKLRLDSDGAIADVLVEIPLGASERFGIGLEFEIALDACEPTPLRRVLPLGATAVLRNAGASQLNPLVKDVFNVTLAPGATKRFTPDKAGSVRCVDPVHPWVELELVVTDNRYTTLTDEHGRYRIPDLPRGEYGVVFTHPKLGRRVELDVAIGGGVERELVVIWDPRSKPVGR